ncbi:DMT family transporter [Planctobacterium marinum]|uniref:Transporter n=1 Tax=Planctobacterium marinum TaxID=1631968 RepID=A0AA48HQE1_9ALTE|nr:putative transporter [Planctobacterium marinum]
MENRPVFGFSLSLLTAFMWGVLPHFMLLALTVIDPITVSFYRFLFAFFVVLCVITLKKQWPDKKQFQQGRLAIVLLAGLALSANYVGYVKSLEYLHPETAQVIIQLAPFLLMLGGVWFFKEVFTRLQMLGAVTLIIGFTLFFDNKWQSLLAFGDGYSVGVFIMVFAAVTWVAYALLQKFLLLHFSARQMTLIFYGLGAIMLLPLSDVASIGALTWISGLALLFCCINTLVAYGSFTRAMSVWEASKVSAIIAMAPVFTILSSGLAVLIYPQFFSHSDLTKTAYLGAFLVVVGSMLTALGRRTKATK